MRQDLIKKATVLIEYENGESVHFPIDGYSVYVEIKNGIDSVLNPDASALTEKLLSNGRKEIIITASTNPCVPLDGEQQGPRYKFIERK